MQQPQHLVSHTRHTPTRHRTPSRGNAVKTHAGFGDIVRSIFDFESWAPRSSRTWRLKPMPGEAMLKADDSAPDQAELDMMMQLRQRQQALGGELATSSGMLDADDPDTAALYRSLQARRSQLGSLDEDETATDPSLAAQQAAEAFLPSTPLTGHVLQTMVMAKYGLQYDLSIVKRDIPGRTLVRLNVMWQHPKQVSFALSEREFDEKMDTIAYYLRAWKQEQVVRDFFSKPPRPSRGLPARPVPGSAVSIKLDVEQAVIDEWFGEQ